MSLIVRDKITRQCPQTTTFEEKGEPKRIRTEVPLLTSLTARPNRLTSSDLEEREHFICVHFQQRDGNFYFCVRGALPSMEEETEPVTCHEALVTASTAEAGQ